MVQANPFLIEGYKSHRNNYLIAVESDTSCSSASFLLCTIHLHLQILQGQHHPSFS